MTPTFELLLMGLVFLGPIVGPLLSRALIRRHAARTRLAFLREAASKAGLSGIEAGDGALDALAGNLKLRISVFMAEETDGIRIEAWGARLAQGLTLVQEGEGSFLGASHPKEIWVGDERFDRQVSVRGAPAVALSLLDADMRGTVAAMVCGRLGVPGHRPFWATGQVRDGTLRVDLPERSSVARGTRKEREELKPASEAFLDGEYRLPELLRAVVDLATRLTAPVDLASRLASNLAGEETAGVRLRTLLLLLREFPEHPATREALAAAREDPDAEVRARAAIALGADGRDVLLGIAAGEGAEDATSAAAVAALGRALSPPQAAELLKRALRTRRLDTAGQCLAVLGGHGAEAVPIVAKVLLVERGKLGVAAAQALAATGDPSAEAPLLRALAETAPDVQSAAAAALGRVGTRDAVAPLREVEAGDPALRATARQAIAEIHARMAGAEQGQLSLAHGESGQLSIAEGEAGRLSLSDGARTAAGERDDPEGGRTRDAGPEPAQ